MVLMEISTPSPGDKHGGEAKLEHEAGPSHCPSCLKPRVSLIGAIPAAFLFAGRPLDAPLPGGGFWKCMNCDLHFRWPRIPILQLDRLYQIASPKNWSYALEDRYDWKVTTQLINESGKAGKILDVGCFDGGFLRHVSRRWDKYGVEPNRSAANRARASGVRIIGRTWDDLEPADLEFDLVVAMDLIEHVESPLNFLKTLTRLVKRDGRCIISTGNTDALSWRLLKSRYWYCTNPEHISFVAPDWCYGAARNLGLDIEQIRRFSHAGKTTVARRIYEALANVVYYLSPTMLASLRTFRKNSITSQYVSKFQELKFYPPSWKSSRDHILVVFRKCGCVSCSPCR